MAFLLAAITATNTAQPPTILAFVSQTSTHCCSLLPLPPLSLPPTYLLCLQARTPAAPSTPAEVAPAPPAAAARQATPVPAPPASCRWPTSTARAPARLSTRARLRGRGRAAQARASTTERAASTASALRATRSVLQPSGRSPAFKVGERRIREGRRDFFWVGEEGGRGEAR